jgi:hypothetical protein
VACIGLVQHHVEGLIGHAHASANNSSVLESRRLALRWRRGFVPNIARSHFTPIPEAVGAFRARPQPEQCAFTGFVMPRLEAIRDDGGAVVDVVISYPCDLETQMLEYSALSRVDSDVFEPPARAR